MREHSEPESSARVEHEFIRACTDDDSEHRDLVARYLTRRRLARLLTSITSALGTSSRPSLQQHIQRLERVGLVLPIGAAIRRADQPFWLTPRGGRRDAHDPVALVACIDEGAIVAHLSALVVHELTLSRPQEHFVVVPKAAPRSRNRSRSPVAPRLDGHANTGPRRGRPVFECGDLVFRARSARADQIFGARIHWIDDREKVRLFDLERSLLHTLTDPTCNGGARGVVEAWERATHRVDASRLLEYLSRLDRLALWRRAGALADRLGWTRVAESVARQIPPPGEGEEPLPLIPRTPGLRVLSPWHVLVPW